MRRADTATVLSDINSMIPTNGFSHQLRFAWAEMSDDSKYVSIGFNQQWHTEDRLNLFIPFLWKTYPLKISLVDI